MMKKHVKRRYVIDIGPGAGINGGNIIAQGTPNQICIIKKVSLEILSEEQLLTQ